MQISCRFTKQLTCNSRGFRSFFVYPPSCAVNLRACAAQLRLVLWHGLPVPWSSSVVRGNHRSVADSRNNSRSAHPCFSFQLCRPASDSCAVNFNASAEHLDPVSRSHARVGTCVLGTIWISCRFTKQSSSAYPQSRCALPVPILLVSRRRLPTKATLASTLILSVSTAFHNKSATMTKRLCATTHKCSR